MKPTREEIFHRCHYHPPSKDAMILHENTREDIEDLMNVFVSRLPECRETSLALTKLEEAMFWANAAIARNHDKI